MTIEKFAHDKIMILQENVKLASMTVQVGNKNTQSYVKIISSEVEKIAFLLMTHIQMTYSQIFNSTKSSIGQKNVESLSLAEQLIEEIQTILNFLSQHRLRV